MTGRRQPKLADRWLHFAKEDLRVVPVLIEEEAFGLACFHAQQAAEKAIKALIVYHDGTVPKVHQLGELLVSVCKFVPAFKRFETTSLTLDQYYIPARYPDALPGSRADEMPKIAESQAAFVAASELVGAVERSLR